MEISFDLLGTYIAFIMNSSFGFDPILVAIAAMPAFYALGVAIYHIYDVSFERRGDTALRGLSFFFGLLFITEVAQTLNFGVIDLPLRLLVPALVSIALMGALHLYLSRTFIGRAIQAVAQDPLALRLMAADPSRIKRIAFGLSIATASVAGAILIIIQPIEPSVGRDYIGRIFAICVLGGMGSFAGTLVAAIILGVMENLTATFFGPSWAPAVAFGFLLL